MMGMLERLTDHVSVSHYDMVLAAIPSVFVVGILVGNVLSLPTNVAIAGASLAASLALADALFVHPPTASE